MLHRPPTPTRLNHSTFAQVSEGEKREREAACSSRGGKRLAGRFLELQTEWKEDEDQIDELTFPPSINTHSSAHAERLTSRRYHVQQHLKEYNK